MKKLIFMSICVILFVLPGCSKGDSINAPVLFDSENITTDSTMDEPEPESAIVTESATTYVIDEKKSLNTDYHIKHEATEIAHLESLFDTLNEFN